MIMILAKMRANIRGAGNIRSPEFVPLFSTFFGAK